MSKKVIDKNIFVSKNQMETGPNFIGWVHKVESAWVGGRKWRKQGFPNIAQIVRGPNQWRERIKNKKKNGAKQNLLRREDKFQYITSTRLISFTSRERET